LLGAFLVQYAATLAVPAFAEIGPAATSAWRFFVGAIVLLALSRPKVRSWTRAQWAVAGFFGVSTAVMNQCFYQSIHRIPLGTAVAIEYLGPFLVAAIGKRSRRHAFFVILAALGVVALARPGGGLNATGVLLACGAGCGWAAYTVASHRVGGATEGFQGLAVAMSIAALCTFPFVAGSMSHVVGTPSLLARLSVMAILAVVLGFGAEMQALRRLKPSIVGVLLSFDPAVAFLVGLIFLHQHVHPLDLVGMALVVVAGVGVMRDANDAGAATSM
jgi:inner membrane transporter RhtA